MTDQETVGGFHAVNGLLQKRASRIEVLLVDAGRNDRRMQELLAEARQRSVRVEKRPRKELDALLESGQGVIACLRADRISNEADLDELLTGMDQPPLLLILDSVTDPHNLGACLRSANAAGVDAVIVPKDKSAPLNATARKVACGAAELTPLIRVTNLARTMGHLKNYGVWLVGTCGEADTLVYDQPLTGPLALVMGAEDKGLRRLTREQCDALVRLPMAGGVSSLNVSVATGVTLFEAVRQRNSG